MRLLHVIDSGDPSGGGPVMGIRNLAAFHVQEGHHVDVVTLDQPDSPWLKGAPGCWYALGGSPRGFSFSWRFLKWLRKNVRNYDVVILNGLWKFPNLAVWWELRVRSKLPGGLTQLGDCPFYVFPHGMLDPWFKNKYPKKHAKKAIYWGLVEQYVLRDAAAVCFTCEEERQLARTTFAPYRCIERVVGFGIAPPPCDTARQVSLFFESFPAVQSRPYLLFLSRLHEKKGVDLLLRGYARLSRERAVPLPTLVIAGPSREGYGKSLIALAQRLGLRVSDGRGAPSQNAGTVHFLPMLQGDLKWGAFRGSEAFVLPSHQENFGIAVVEALACAKPVLITNKVNIWREIHSSGAGIVRDDSDEGVFGMLREWLTASEPSRSTMADRALECFATHFHIKAAADALIEVISEGRKTKIHEDNNCSRSLLSRSSH